MRKGAALLIILLLIITVAFIGGSYVSASKLEVEFESSDNAFYIVVRNPTPFPYVLESFEAKILYRSMELGTVSLPSPLKIPPRGEARSQLTVDLNVGNLLLISLVNPASNDDVLKEIVINGYYRVVPTLGPISLFSIEGTKQMSLEEILETLQEG